MVQAGEDPVAEFLALMQQEKYTEAAKDFDDLVGHFCPSGKRMTPQQEQELHLRPTKPFKKVNCVLRAARQEFEMHLLFRPCQ